MATVISQTKQTETATRQTVTASNSKATKNDAGFLFGKQNYTWMAISGALIVLGFIAMAGGKSVDPTQFKTEDVYSTMRITIAPLLIIAGLCSMVYAIMRSSTNSK
jgi:isoprenylcysteine carboxyl methyltransferase (ICMT) family protein YpbQ